ncbi:MAG: acetyl-CoA C-acetyltransferase [Deltaproteobacteria bacterium]|nr:acetyl-CoA C-acetyltransferase [Deltaproteobacteria bacterium]
MPQAVIVSAVRTPIGAFQGSLSSLPAARLGAVAIKAAIERAGLKPDQIEQVYMGNVLLGGQGQAPARQASIYAGLPATVPCTTISKVCGSGLKSVMMAATEIRAGETDVIVAGGMESMSTAPYYLPRARGGYRMGNGEVIDGMVFDGLWDPYNNVHMGSFGDKCAREKKFTREEQDAFAQTSYERAQKAQADGAFKNEIVPVEIPQKKGDPILVTQDEEPARANFKKARELKPAFNKDGTVTAANASKIDDAAAAVVVVSDTYAKQHNLKVLATIVAYDGVAQEPDWFTTAPIGAIKKTLTRAKLSTRDIDLWEINEAFSVVTLITMRELELDHAKVNVNGGAVALGHPIGCSGARVLVTLLHAMQARDAKRGLATLCIGGGEAAAMVIER